MYPLKVCSALMNYGVDDDIILAAALLHDVLEECGDKLPLKGQELITVYHIDKEVLNIITLLTKESGLDNRELGIYFKAIEGNYKVALIKLNDRLHNSATLYTFTFEKMKKYIMETDEFLIPMASYCKNYYPEYANVFTTLKSNIYSINNSMRIMMQKYDEGNRIQLKYAVLHLQETLTRVISKMQTGHKAGAFDATKEEDKGSVESRENPLDRVIRNIDMRFCGGGIDKPDDWGCDTDDGF